MDIIERIDRAGEDYPDKIAHVSGDRTLTYGELSEKSDAVAGYLRGIEGCKNVAARRRLNLHAGAVVFEGGVGNGERARR